MVSRSDHFVQIFVIIDVNYKINRNTSNQPTLMFLYPLQSRMSDEPVPDNNAH